MKLNEISIKFVTKYGDKHWKQIGSKLCHRLNDLPAIEWKDGTKEWCINGRYHRDGGKPAVELSNGSKEWYVNGKLIKKL